MFPKISARPTYMLNIPALSGGVNKRDGISLINDNQMVALKNMIYKDGVLKTRDSVKAYENNYLDLIDIEDIRAYPDINFVSEKSNNNYVLYIAKYNKIASPGPKLCAHAFFVSNSNGFKIQGIGEITPYLIYNTLNVLPIMIKNDIYFLCGTHGESRDNSIFDDYYYETYKASISPSSTWGEDLYINFKKIDLDSESKIPLVVTNCIPDITNNTGTTIAGYNLINSYYKMRYSTVNPKNDTTEMTYLLLHPIDDGTNSIDRIFDYALSKKITAEITYANGTVAKHEINITYDEPWEEKTPNEIDNLRMVISTKAIQFLDSDNKPKKLSKDDYLQNNLEITAPWDNSYKFKVFCMEKKCFFGGSSEGLNGGTRLFLGGSTDPKQKNLVIYSDFNNPLYFPENCYFYVGDAGEKVTAFGKQGESLVIFKEREIYCTYYKQSNMPTAEQVENQNIIDLTIAGDYFPLVQIHSYIGCDCPDTVQLCRNKLVWLSSDGKVYTLTSPNQYTERSVFCVSEMIDNEFKPMSKQTLIEAKSADYDGLYIISIGNKMYCMDYNSYGYNYVYSYSKTEDANKLIPWYIWELPIEPDNLISSGKQLLIAAYYGTMFDFYYMNNEGDEDIVYYWENTETMMKKIPIHSIVQTKSFDFGQPAFNKNVSLVNVSLGFSEGCVVDIRFVTEQGVFNGKNILINSKPSNERNAAHFKNYEVRPTIKNNVRFGIEIESNKKIEINSVSIRYRVLGGAK